MTKADRIRVLLETMDDPYPTPQGTLTDRSTGIDPTKIPCHACRGKGMVVRRVRLHGRQHPVRRLRVCDACDGAKYRRARKGEDGVDPYTFEPIPGLTTEGYDVDPARLRTLGQDHDARAEQRARDASIARLQANARARAGVIDKREKYGWERERERLDEAGDYPKLRRLLERMPPGVDPLSWLVEHWDGNVRVPGWLVPRQRAKTAQELYAEGRSIGYIARHLNMRKEKVRKAVGIEKAAA